MGGWARRSHRSARPGSQRVASEGSQGWWRARCAWALGRHGTTCTSMRSVHARACTLLSHTYIHITTAQPTTTIPQTAPLCCPLPPAPLTPPPFYACSPCQHGQQAVLRALRKQLLLPPPLRGCCGIPRGWPQERGRADRQPCGLDWAGAGKPPMQLGGGVRGSLTALGCCCCRGMQLDRRRRLAGQDWFTAPQRWHDSSSPWRMPVYAHGPQQAKRRPKGGPACLCRQAPQAVGSRDLVGQAAAT